ncbi:phospholipase A and acyltransferase 4 [Leptonychotes weddellii]|uniref:Phospholipase A and acyltransferase 4 n=1 Tax=Leptonychotes weddellii TaxID=9713 RepID=A0A7F8RXS3_LEPWE|nr:phospholipase A and acyltransferase 4 [Leptonychotes weddellii]
MAELPMTMVVSLIPGEYLGAGSGIIFSILSNRVVVRQELLQEVMGSCHHRVYNLLDYKCRPRPLKLITYSAKEKIGQEMKYSVLGRSSEDFVTNLRYGEPNSRQVAYALTGGGATLAMSLLGIVGYFLLKS